MARVCRCIHVFPRITCLLVSSRGRGIGFVRSRPILSIRCIPGCLCLHRVSVADVSGVCGVSNHMHILLARTDNASDRGRYLRHVPSWLRGARHTMSKLRSGYLHDPRNIPECLLELPGRNLPIAVRFIHVYAMQPRYVSEHHRGIHVHKMRCWDVCEHERGDGVRQMQRRSVSERNGRVHVHPVRHGYVSEHHRGIRVHKMRRGDVQEHAGGLGVRQMQRRSVSERYGSVRVHPVRHRLLSEHERRIDMLVMRRRFLSGQPGRLAVLPMHRWKLRVSAIGRRMHVMPSG